jgi:hypothetical protein
VFLVRSLSMIAAARAYCRRTFCCRYCCISYCLICWCCCVPVVLVLLWRLFVEVLLPIGPPQPQCLSVSFPNAH